MKRFKLTVKVSHLEEYEVGANSASEAMRKFYCSDFRPVKVYQDNYETEVIEVEAKE